MAEEMINRTFLDRLTNLDELILEGIKVSKTTNASLAAIAESLGAEIPVKIQHANYPVIGTKTLSGVGTTTFNLKQGTVVFEDATIDKLSQPIDGICRSITVYTNKEIELRLHEEDRPELTLTVFPYWFRSTHIRFNRVEVKTTCDTELNIAVSSANEGTPSITAAEVDVVKAEATSILETVSTTHFTDAILINNHEEENLTGLTEDKVYIRGVNIQSAQNLHYRLIFWSKDTFDNTAIDTDSYLDDVDLDMTAAPAFRIGAANQYYLNVSGLGIIYEDEDETKELHMSLQNVAGPAKNAGAAGEVQLDILYSPR